MPPFATVTVDSRSSFAAICFALVPSKFIVLMRKLCASVTSFEVGRPCRPFYALDILCFDPLNILGDGRSEDRAAPFETAVLIHAITSILAWQTTAFIPNNCPSQTKHFEAEIKSRVADRKPDDLVDGVCAGEISTAKLPRPSMILRSFVPKKLLVIACGVADTLFLVMVVLPGVF